MFGWLFGLCFQDVSCTVLTSHFSRVFCRRLLAFSACVSSGVSGGVSAGVSGGVSAQTKRPRICDASVSQSDWEGDLGTTCGRSERLKSRDT